MQKPLLGGPSARPSFITNGWFRRLALLALLLSGPGAWAQVIRTLPGDYASFTAAITDVNTNFATGGVTVNVAAGYTETVPAGGLPLLTAQGSSGAGQIIFQKAGSGTNPKITAGVGSSTSLDGIVRLSGADYVTFDGIDLLDPSTNTSQTTAAEYGFALFRDSPTNGCQNNTIRNCTVTLNRSGSGSTSGVIYGIYLASTYASGIAVTPTAASGSNSGNKCYANTVLNTQMGINAVGYADAAPYALADQGNDFGGTAASTGNTIRNFGGVSGSIAFGIRATNQQSPNASYNTVDNAGGGGTATTGSLYGVYAALGASGNCTLNNNTVTLTQAPTASTGVQATAVFSSHSGTGTASLSNNVASYTVTASTSTASANIRYMVQTVNSAAIGALNMSGNQITYNLTNSSSGGISGSVHGAICQGSVTGNATLSNNTVTYNIANSGSGSVAANCYGVVLSAGTGVTIGGNLTLNSNTTTHALNLSSTGSTTGSLIGVINFLPVTGNLLANGNTLNLTGSNASTTFGSTLQGVSNQSAGTVGGSSTFNGNTANYGTATTAFANTAGTMSGSLFGCTNAAALAGTASFSNNVVNYYLATAGTALSSALTAISNTGAITGTAAISGNVLAYSGTRTAGTFTSTFTGVSSTGATASTLTLDGNTLLNSSTASTGAMTIIQATGASTGLLTLSNNRYQNGTTSSTGQIYFINAGTTAPNILAQSNQFTSFIKNGTSTATVYGYYNFTTPSAAGTHTITSNTITGLNLTGSAGTFTSPFIGILTQPASTTTQVVTNNTLGATATGGAITAGASVLAGIMVGYGTNNSVVSGNVVQNLTNSGTGAIVGLSTTSSSTNPISATSSLLGGTLAGNTIGSLSTSGVAGVYGMFLTSSSSATAALGTSGNKISELSAGGAGAATVYGLYVAGGLAHTLANNVVGNLTAPASTSSPALVGLYLNAGTTLNASYNTVYLAGSGGTNFGAAGIAFTGTPGSITLNNNLVQNTATANGTGQSVALGRVTAGTAGTVPANLSAATNSNLLYASSGTLYAEGLATATPTNAKTTLFGYRNFMYSAPGSANSSLSREQRTVSAAVSFVSTTGSSADFLRPTAAALIEGGALPLAGISTDYAGAARSTTPDIGAYEGSYTYLDVVAPGITYTPLASTNSTTNRALANVAVADVAPGSGVSTAPGTKPRLYYKLSTDANAYNDNTSGTPGWKYTEATGSASPFDFVIDYSLLPAALVPGSSVIQYFVVAQDGATTPNVALNAGTFAVQPASVALTGAAFPIGGPINQYAILAPLPTAILVGTGQAYTSLTNTGGVFEAINNGVLAGNTTVTITSDLAGETGAVALGPLADGGNNYTLTVQSDGTLRNITGTATNAAGMVRLAGARRVIFDGQQPAGTTSLRFGNTTAGAPTFGLTADASNNKLTWLIAESANTSATSGTIVLGNGTATGSSFNEVTVVDIRSTNNATTATYANGIYSAGLSSTVANGPNYVYYCQVHNFSGSGVYLAGSNNNGWTVTGNSLFQEAARTTDLTPVRVAGGSNHTLSNNNIYQAAGTISGAFTGISLIGGGTGHTVSGNFVGGSGSGATGGSLTATGTLSGMLLTVGTGTATSVQGNTVRALTGSATGTTAYGINVTAGAVNIGTVTGNTIGSATASQGIFSGYNNRGISVTSTAPVAISNNEVRNLQNTASPALSVYMYGIFVNNTATSTVSGNTVSGVTNATLVDDVNDNGPLARGIYSSNTGVITVQGNQVSNIGSTTATTGTSSANSFNYVEVSGIYLYQAGSGSRVLRNRVWNVYSSSNGTGNFSDEVYGLFLSATGAQVANNQLSLLASAAAAPFAVGIYDATGGNTFAFNSVYLAGAGTLNTYGFLRANTAALSLRNNIFYNARTGGGSNYAVGTSSATGFVGAPANPATNSSDYNLFIAADATKVGFYGTTGYSFAGWKTATGGDASSLSETAAAVPAASFFADAANGDLALQAGSPLAWYANGTGTQLATIGTDYAGTARPTTVAAGAPDLGAVELTPTSTPPALAASAAPALGGTQSFALGGRTLASLTYGPAGTVPTNVVARYYSGTNPPAPFVAGARYANAYFDFQNAGGDGSGFTYQPTLAYDPALLGTIASEAAQRISQRTAANDGYNTYANTTVSPAPARTLALGTGLGRFGILAISDAAAPLPVELVRFEATRQAADALLTWTTASERDNQGFEVQVSADGSSFRTLGFVAGAGSSSSARSYRFLDGEAGKTGLRYYRLRQLDGQGPATFSPVRTVLFEAAAGQLLAWPNPSQQAPHLSLTLPQAAPTATLTLSDALGRLVLRQELGALPAGLSQPVLDGPAFGRLPVGVYVLRLATPTATHTLKLVKE